MDQRRPIKIVAFSCNKGSFTLEFPVLSSARTWLVFGVWRLCLTVPQPLAFLRARSVSHYFIYSQYNALLDWLRAEVNAAAAAGTNRLMNRPASGRAKLLNTKLAHSTCILY